MPESKFRYRANTRSDNRPSISRQHLQDLTRSRDLVDALGSRRLTGRELGELRVSAQFWRDELNRFAHAAPVRHRNHSLGIQAMTYRPIAPRSFHTFRRIHEHAVQVEEDRLASKRSRGRHLQLLASLGNAMAQNRQSLGGLEVWSRKRLLE